MLTLYWYWHCNRPTIGLAHESGRTLEGYFYSVEAARRYGKRNGVRVRKATWEIRARLLPKSSLTEFREVTQCAAL